MFISSVFQQRLHHFAMFEMTGNMKWCVSFLFSKGDIDTTKSILVTVHLYHSIMASSCLPTLSRALILASHFSIKQAATFSNPFHAASWRGVRPSCTSIMLKNLTPVEVLREQQQQKPRSFRTLSRASTSAPYFLTKSRVK